MTIFRYDKSFPGLLTCLFDAYLFKDFPEQLLETDTPLPLFCDHNYTIVTDEQKEKRVWNHIKAKLSNTAIKQTTLCWLSELPEIDLLLFRYFRKIIDSPINIETNLADPDILKISEICKKVSREGHRLIQFARFQKCADNTYFAPLEPLYNTIPLTISHFRDRFADQKFLIYDTKRQYGYYYDLETVTEVTFTNQKDNIINGILKKEITDEDETKYQKLWQTYFKSIVIKERINPKKQKQDMPVRYWKYLTEIE